MKRQNCVTIKCAAVNFGLVPAGFPTIIKPVRHMFTLTARRSHSGGRVSPVLRPGYGQRWRGLTLGIAATLCSAALTTAALPPERIHLLDLRTLKQRDVSQSAVATGVWETMHAAAALQGIVNRHTPRFYLLYCADFGVETDQFWLDWLRHEDGWLQSARMVPLRSLEEAVRTFQPQIKGVVVYDPAVPATACLASTVAGCEDVLPVRFSRATNSLYARLVGSGQLPVKVWLVNPDGTSKFTGRGQLPDANEASSGSAKVDVYRWGLQHYLPKCDARFAAYYLDAFWLQRPRNGPPDLHTLSNHDYFIAQRAFFFDLSPWGDESPVDDPAQRLGLDRETLLAILAGLQAQVPGEIIKIGGFPPWPFKYTTHGHAGRHEGVPTEWEFTRLISQFNAYHEADAAGFGGMANASFFAHYPLRERYAQPNRKPAAADWQRAGWLTEQGKVSSRLYVGHYVGDYDSPSWLYKAVPSFFRDPERGQVPLNWAFDPNLADRAPHVFAYVYRHASSNDFFIAGDSGAGYLNPRGLTHRPDSGLPSGLTSWTTHNQRYFTQWDMSITGFMLDGSSGASTAREFAAYRQFSPDGCGTHFEKGPRLIAGVATCPERDLPDSAAEAAQLIADLAKSVRNEPQFLWARSILKSPTWYAQVSRLLKEKYPDAPVAVVDAYTFFGLIRQRHGP
ncbi:MAG TPA: GxGYxYP family putative glycoside hydrolase [Verrucomicrobiota bacterium]|nr:GxGYxYP family putative glycoside hydrolase [Verrucomicrobiota bacterium]HNT13263.1 GxGYxYP family putative glycoside hydrolase [Verrucomicrobiota bacterium]